MYEIEYNHCGETWIDTWDCLCNSECPICGKEIEYTCYDEILTEIEPPNFYPSDF